jgi:multidrug efflux system membrane fusion protein
VADSSAATAGSSVGVEAAQATVEYRKVEFDRADQLFKEGAVPESQVDEKRVALRLARLQLEQARLQRRLDALEAERDRAILERLTIAAPFDGYVAKIYLAEGERVEERRPVARLVSYDPLHVIAHVRAEPVSPVKVGDRGYLKLDRLDQELECTVFFIDQVVDATSSTRRVKLRLPNPNFKVAPGLHGKVRFGSKRPVASPPKKGGKDG